MTPLEVGQAASQNFVSDPSKFGVQEVFDPAGNQFTYVPTSSRLASVVPRGDIAVDPKATPNLPFGTDPATNVRGAADNYFNAAEGAGVSEAALGGIATLGGIAEAAGYAGLVYGAYVTGSQAIKQAEAGDYAGAAQTIGDFGAAVAAGVYGAEIGGSLGSTIGGGIGLAVGGIPGGILGAEAGELAGTIAGAIGGAVLGQELAKEIGNGISKLLNAAVGALGTNGSYIANALLAFAGAQRDPLVIDLSGKGLNLVDRSASSPYFDFTGSGFAHSTGWIGSGTGFLAIAGADGLVDNGTQLFGTGGADGFAALKALDSNGDGVIDASDPGFSKLIVWQDLNGDGVCEAGEVSTLAQLGIASLSLKTTNVWQASGDATIVETALATMTDGTTREVAEANLDVSSLNTRYVGPYTPDPAVAGLPDLKGYGALPNLSISMSQDGQLKALVQQLVQTDPSNTVAFDAAMRAMLYRWGGVDGAAPASGGAFDGQELGFLRKLLGNTTGFGWGGASSTPWFEGQSNLLQKSWDTAYNGLKARLLTQLPGSPFANDFTADPATDLVVPRTTLPDAIVDLAVQAPKDGTQLAYWLNALTVVNASVADLAQYLTLDTAKLTADLQAVAPAALFSPEILAAAASGTLSFVEGTALGGKLAGTPGSDLFMVEQPDAVLIGLGGGDEFVVGAGLGAVEINEADNTAGAHDVLLLDSITPSQVAVSGDAAGDLILTLADGGTVKLDNMLVPLGSGGQVAEGHDYNALTASTHYGVQEVRFADGTVWTAQQLIQQELSATANNGDTLYGTAGADVLDGQGLKHVVQGNGGGDTFAFGQGYGALEVKEVDGNPAAANVLQLGPGITAAQVAVSGTAAGDIVLATGSAGDTVKLDGMLLSTQDSVQAVRFADGTTWTAQQVRALAATGSPGNTSLVDLMGSATLDPASYAHLVTTRGGNDTVLFDAGYGSVEVNQRDGNAQNTNILRFGPGIDPTEVTASGDANGNVVLTVGSDGDRVQLDGMLLGPGNGVQEVRFADGTVWGAQQIVSQVPGGGSAGQYFATLTLNRGDGQAATAVTGTGAVVLGSGIAAGDAYLQADAAGNLVVRLRDDPSDSLTVGNAFYNDGNGAHSRLSQLTYADGTSLDLTKQLPLTWLASATSLSLSGSNDGANLFVLAPGGDVATGSSRTANTYVFHKGDGQATVIPTGGSNTIQLGSGLGASDVVLQADDATGDLTLRVLDTGDTLTVKGDLSRQGWGVQSQVGQISFGDGTALHLSPSYWDQGQPLAFTWIGAGTGAPLVGSGYGSNTFILGPGGTHAVAGNGGLGGSNQNTFMFDKGDGRATIDMNNGWGTLQLGADIPGADVVLQADAAGDLTLSLRDDPKDSLVITGDLSRQGWGVQSQLTAISFGDGTSLQFGQSYWNQGQPIPFTWTGTAATTALVGSNFGPNTFDLGPGGDQVTFGNNSQGGSGSNTVLFDRGDGQVAINLNGGTGVLQFGADIPASDVYFQANAAGDLIIGLRDSLQDGLTIKGDLARGWWGGPTSKIGQISFGDGSTLQLGQRDWWDSSLLNFTWTGTATSTTLVGSNYGDNTFVLGAGGDAATGGQYGNTYLYGKGDGAATITINGSNTLKLGAGISAGDLTFQANDATGDLVILDGAAGDSITLKGDLSRGWWGGPTSKVGQLTFADGSAFQLGQKDWWDHSLLTFTTVGTVGQGTLAGSNYGNNVIRMAPGNAAVGGQYDNTFYLASGNPTVTGGGGSNTYHYDIGDGAATVLPNGSGTIQLGAGINAGGLTFQANDSTGDLTILDGAAGDSITLKNDLARGWWGGPTSKVGQISFSDGSAFQLGQKDWWDHSLLTFTWTGTAANTVLVGSNYGNNTFRMGAGGSAVGGGYDNTFYLASGNPTATGGAGNNTYYYAAGDGAATILPHGTGSIVLAAGISAAALTFQDNDATGDLTINIGTAGDSIVLKGDLGRGWWGGPTSKVGQLAFADGSTLQLGQRDWWDHGLLNFTWTGTSANTTLVGSNYGDNTFVLGAGGDIITGGQYGNTYLYGNGDGAATITLNGGSTVKLAAGISAGDLTFEANDVTGDLVILDGAAGDNITLKGDLARGWWGGQTSKVGQLTFSDGSTFQLGQKDWWDHSLLNFMATEKNAGTVLAGSNYGNNLLHLVDGGSAVGGKYDNTFFFAADPTVTGGGGNNTYLYDKGEGAATILPNGTGTVQFGAGIAKGDLTFQADDATGDFTINVGSTGDSITLKNDLGQGWWGGPVSKVGQLAFGDGTTLELGQQRYGDNSQLAFTWTGTPTTIALAGSGFGSNTFVLGAGGDRVTFGNGSRGGSNQNTVLFGRGDGQAVVNANGGSGTIQLGTGIDQSDVLLTGDQNGDLNLALRDTGDSLSVHPRTFCLM